jgi:hypothetical protein
MVGGVVREAIRTLVVRGARGTEQNQGSTCQIRTVVVLAGWFVAAFASTEDLRFFTELLVHPCVKEVERTFPKASVAKLLPVAHDATLELVDLLEPARFHQ